MRRLGVNGQVAVCRLRPNGNVRRTSFAPYPGFEAHPYRDYSTPWWHHHRVLRGACIATSVHLADVRYRNFFLPQRRDIFAGFRSASL